MWLFFKRWALLFLLLCCVPILGNCGPLPCDQQGDCPASFYCDTTLFVCLSALGPCRAGTIRSCYTANPASRGVGACKAGQQSCSEKLEWGPCVGEVVPTRELCDGVDNDCNGKTDEGCASAALCESIKFQTRLELQVVQSTEKPKQVRCILTFSEVLPALLFSERPPELEIQPIGWKFESAEISADKRTLTYLLSSETSWSKPFRIRFQGEVLLPKEANKRCTFLYYSLPLEARCLKGYGDCGGVCRDLQEDSAHCGACKKACQAGEECCQGSCRVAIPKEQICGACHQHCLEGSRCCDGRCVPTESDVKNCGGCGVTCKPAEGCCQGICQPLDTKLRCGSCDKACPWEECCGGGCVDVSTSDLHCGVCGKACSSFEYCVSGQCQPCYRPMTVCRWGKKVACVDLKISADTCGDCSTVCKNEAVCVAGKCVSCRQSSECLPRSSCSGVECKESRVCTWRGACHWSSKAKGELTLSEKGKVDEWTFLLDDAGQYTLAGSFTGELRFQLRTIVSEGGHDLFIGRYDPTILLQDQRLLWFKHIGGKGEERAPQLQIDQNANIAMVGLYGGGGHSTAFVEIGNPNAVTLTPPKQAQNAVFLSSFSSTGTLRSVRSLFAGTEHAHPLLTTFSLTGEHGVAFSAKGTSTLKTLGCGQKELHNGKDPFGSASQIAMFRVLQDGSCVWGRLWGSTKGKDVWPTGVQYFLGPDRSEPIGLMGNFEGDLGLDDATLSTNGASDGFVTQISSSGVTKNSISFGSAKADLWGVMRNIGYRVRGPGDKEPKELMIGRLGGVFQFFGVTYNPLGKTDAFFIDAEGGRIQQMLQFGASGGVDVRALVVEWSKTGLVVSSAFVGGVFEGTLTLANGVKMVSHGKKDIFVLRIAMQVNFAVVWAVQIGGTEDEELVGLQFRERTPQNGLHVAGSSSSQRVLFDREEVVKSLKPGEKHLFVWRMK